MIKHWLKTSLQRASRRPLRGRAHALRPDGHARTPEDDDKTPETASTTEGGWGLAATIASLAERETVPPAIDAEPPRGPRPANGRETLGQP